ncbi:MAG: hypothetical protein ACYTGL_25950, partial [Planctomycetota bacterium]
MPQIASRQPRLPESVPSGFRILEPDIDSDFRVLEAAASDNAEPNLRRFTMLAYTGGKLVLANFAFPVVVDLSGLRIPAKSRPILRDHSQQQIVGHTDTIEINGSSIRLTGVLSAANEHAREVADSADNGFPWQASIGAVAGRVVFVASGETVEVNGRKFAGPLYVARQAVLREVSFVALGADDQTSARLAATDAEDTQIEVMLMEFEQWLQAMGFDAGSLSEEQTTGLQSLYAASQSTGEPVGSDESDTEAEAAHTVSATETVV